MNLIEQLGGYESVKELRRYLFCYVDGEHYAEVDKALLEYRRQYNIFEVGDLVVDTNYRDADVQEIKSVSGNRMNVFHKNKSYYFTTFVFSFRHATDDEIKAGHRL